ncbi:hypothetical protein E2C01_028962 [Portunus trituberculatus]|uniref:Uncharacterized protein n=1 Tax=Portunus trituberculatus TaxID=210409 RepID=A0A5B7EQK0_PORTR|nr:hypothetical protein [Portunus trituberculatus]
MFSLRQRQLENTWTRSYFGYFSGAPSPWLSSTVTRLYMEEEEEEEEEKEEEEEEEA